MKTIFSVFITVCLLVRASAADVTVSAAASLTDALQEIAALYEKDKGQKIRFNFGASSMLERQIEENAPVDVFFSADELKMDALEKAGLLATGTRHPSLQHTCNCRSVRQ